MAERAGCETPILMVAASKPICSKVLLIRGLFIFFFLSCCVVFSLVFAKRCLASVFYLCDGRGDIWNHLFNPQFISVSFSCAVFGVFLVYLQDSLLRGS